jgi:hypothetical protein
MGFEDPHCGVEQSKFTASTLPGAARALAPLYVNLKREPVSAA